MGDPVSQDYGLSAEPKRLCPIPKSKSIKRRAESTYPLCFNRTLSLDTQVIRIAPVEHLRMRHTGTHEHAAHVARTFGRLSRVHARHECGVQCRNTAASPTVKLS